MRPICMAWLLRSRSTLPASTTGFQDSRLHLVVGRYIMMAGWQTARKSQWEAKPSRGANRELSPEKFEMKISEQAAGFRAGHHSYDRKRDCAPGCAGPGLDGGTGVSRSGGFVL